MQIFHNSILLCSWCSLLNSHGKTISFILLQDNEMILKADPHSFLALVYLVIYYNTYVAQREYLIYMLA